jgi:hypothetical protein
MSYLLSKPGFGVSLSVSNSNHTNLAEDSFGSSISGSLGICISKDILTVFLFCFVLFFMVLGFELRAYTLSHSTSPFL